MALRIPLRTTLGNLKKERYIIGYVAILCFGSKFEIGESVAQAGWGLVLVGSGRLR